MPRVRLLFDELLPQVVARALRELGFRVSHVGNVDDGSPAYGASDEEVLAHARQTNQVIVTSNHDMIVLCAEQVASVVWTDPRGRQFRRAELVVVAFGGIERWEQALSDASAPLCIRVLRTKTEVLSLERAAELAARRMRRLRSRQRAPRRRRQGEPLDGLG